MTLLIVGVLAVLAYVPIVYILRRDDRRERAQADADEAQLRQYEPAHASQPAIPPRRAGRMSRAARRIPEAVRRAPGTMTSRPVVPGRRRGAPGLSAAGRSPGRARPGTVLHHEPCLDREDTATLNWLRSMRGLRHPGQNAIELRGRLAMLRALLNVPGRATPSLHTAGSPGSGHGHPAGDPKTSPAGQCAHRPTTISGGQQYAATHANDQGNALTQPGTTTVRDCLRCGGPASERWYAPGATGGPVTCPDDWHDEDAPGPGDYPFLAIKTPGAPIGTRLIPVADRAAVTAQVLNAVEQRAAELADIHAMPVDDYFATLADYEREPWPLDQLASDTFVGGMTAIEAGV